MRVSLPLLNIFIMKLLFFFVVTLSIFAESKSSPLGLDGRKEDLYIQCLVEVLTKVVSKPDGTSLQPECKDILQKQGSSHTLLMKKNEKEMESNTRVQEILNELLKTNEEKQEDLDEERSQEEFPNYYKRNHLLTSKEKREDPDNERSQEEFPQKRHSLLSTKEKREDPDEERSQEEFPAYEHKRHLFLTSKEKREDPDEERSQEEFPAYEHKRHLFLTSKEKREDPDEERSQEEFPAYEHKRHLFLTSKEKRDDPDYDRSQEDFPSYVYKRYHDEDGGTEKKIWKPHRFHNKWYDGSLNDDFVGPSSQEKRFEEESAKQYWNPVQQYHKNHHKQNVDSSDDEMESEENEKKDWKPSYKNHHMNFFHKAGTLENENNANLHQSLETSKPRSPEEEEEELIAQDLNKNKHHYDSQKEQKRHHSDAEETTKEKEAELRYLTKKKNELEERLLKEGEVYDKLNPWIYRGYDHPALYKQSAEGNKGVSLQKLEELANALRYKMGLLSEKESIEGDKAYLHQRSLTPEELKELEKLASVEQ